MREFQDSFKIHKQSFISTFSICMTVPLINVDVAIHLSSSEIASTCFKSTIKILEQRP